MNYQEYYSARVAVGALAAGVLAGFLYASLALASALFGVFGVLDWGRLVVAIAMITIAGSVYLLSEKWASLASTSIAVCSFIYLMSVPLFVVWARRHGVELRLGFAASMSIGLVLHYAVLRMSSVNSMAVAGPASLIGSVLVFENVDLDSVRALVYLVAANVTGFVLCRVLEERERVMVDARVEVLKIWNRINVLRNDYLEQRRKEKIWVAAIAHELGQPLLVARHHVDRITNSLGIQSNNDQKGLYRTVRYVEEALSEVEFGFNKIVNQVRLSTEIVVVRMGWVDVRTLIEDAIEAVEVQGSRFLQLLELNNSAEGFVYTDRFLAVRVIRNIIENAINSAPNYHPKVRLRTIFDLDTGGFRVVVINRVHRGLRDTLIEGQAPASQKSIGKGLGVGLSIVRNFTSALPGHAFNLRVKKGVGARAGFVIPEVFYRPFVALGGFERGLTNYRIRLFIDALDLRLTAASFFGDRGLPIELSEVDQLEYSVKNSLDIVSSSGDDIFIVEVIPRLMSAEYFFGKELYETMSVSGRYIFLARGVLDASFSDLGVAIDISAGDRFLRKCLDKFIFPDNSE